MGLSARRVETAGPGKYNDGRGLMLVVKESGARSWVLRCQVNGRRRDVGLGSWPDVTLAVARDKAIETRRLMRQGGDPVAAKRRALTTCFQDAAAALIVSKRDGWRNAKHAAQWSTTLATYAYPKLGNMDVGAVTVDDVLAVLKPIWSEKPETASRVRALDAPLALDMLKHRPTFDVRPEDHVQSVKEARIVLGAPDFGAIATFEVSGSDQGRSGSDLYDRAERAFGRNGIPQREGWPVIGAKLRVRFAPEKPKARAKSVTFEMKAPDRTNLRDQIELHRRIADSLLARWGLYAPEE